MCMTVSHSFRDPITGYEFGSFVATDTRAGIRHDRRTGKMLSPGYDAGGRLVSTGSGWAVGSGSSTALAVALKALRSPASENVRGLGAVLASAGFAPRGRTETEREAPSGGRYLTRAAGDGDWMDDSYISVMAVDASNPNSVTVTNGAGCFSHPNALHITLPPDFQGERFQDVLQRMGTELAARDVSVALAFRISVAAKYFDEVSRTSEIVSRVIEVGYILPTPDGPVLGSLRGNAREIANADPSEILERFQFRPDNRVFDEIAGSSSFSQQGSIIPATMAALPFLFNAGGTATGKMWAAFTWGTTTINRSDGTTITIPASSTLPAPPTPTVSTVVSGALGGRTLFVRIGYMKNGMIYRVGPETSIVVPALSVLKVTAPPAILGYDRWVPLVGTASNAEFIQTSTTFDSDYQEAAGGFNSTTTTSYDNTWMPGGVTAQALPASATVYWYAYYDFQPAVVAFASSGALSKNDGDAAIQNADAHYPLSVGGMSVVMPAGGGTTSGTALNGGGKLI